MTIKVGVVVAGSGDSTGTETEILHLDPQALGRGES